MNTEPLNNEKVTGCWLKFLQIATLLILIITLVIATKKFDEVSPKMDNLDRYGLIVENHEATANNSAKYTDNTSSVSTPNTTVSNSDTDTKVLQTNEVTNTMDTRRVRGISYDSLGNITLGKTLYASEEYLGEQVKPPTKDGNMVTFHYRDAGIGVVDDMIVAIYTNTDKLGTERGIFQGDEAKLIFEKYGNNYERFTYKEYTIYEYVYRENGDNQRIRLRFAVDSKTNLIDYIGLRMADE